MQYLRTVKLHAHTGSQSAVFLSEVQTRSLRSLHGAEACDVDQFFLVTFAFCWHSFYILAHLSFATN